MGSCLGLSVVVFVDIFCLLGIVSGQANLYRPCSQDRDACLDHRLVCINYRCICSMAHPFNRTLNQCGNYNFDGKCGGDFIYDSATHQCLKHNSRNGKTVTFAVGGVLMLFLFALVIKKCIEFAGSFYQLTHPKQIITIQENINSPEQQRLLNQSKVSMV